MVRAALLLKQQPKAETIMRILMALPLLAMAACNVTKDGANDQVTVEYNGDVAENAVADVGNAAEDVANDIGQVAKDVGNRVGNTDVDVDVKTDGSKADANAN